MIYGKIKLSMKILLYLEAEQFLSHSGIGRAMKHQQRALDLMGIDWTNNRFSSTQEITNNVFNHTWTD